MWQGVASALLVLNWDNNTRKNHTSQQYQRVIVLKLKTITVLLKSRIILDCRYSYLYVSIFIFLTNCGFRRHTMVLLLAYLLSLYFGYPTCLSREPTCLGTGYPLCWALLTAPKLAFCLHCKRICRNK